MLFDFKYLFNVLAIRMLLIDERVRILCFIKVVYF